MNLLNLNRNIKINYITILFLIFIDILKLNTFNGKRFDRNILYYLKRYSHCRSIIPEFYLNQKLNDDDLMTLQLIDEIENLNSVQHSQSFFKNILYLNQFNTNSKKKILNIANKLIPEFEKLINKKLYLLKRNCIIIKNKGLKINLDCHYDQEHESCYTALFLVYKEGNTPDFIIIDKNNNKKRIKFELGDGIFYNGSNTYHCLDKSVDPDCVQYIISFKYTTNNNYNHNYNYKNLANENNILSGSVLKKTIPNILIYWLVLILSFTLFEKYNSFVNFKIFIYLVLINLILLIVYYNLLKKTFNVIILLKFSLIIMFLIINPYLAIIYLLYILNTETFIMRN